MLDELTDSLKAKLYDFTVSPLLITFIASWIGWNYRLLLVIFSSDMNVYEKTDFIELHLFSTWKDYVGHGFLGPVVTTCILLFAYPYPAKWVFKFWRVRQRELKQLKETIDGESLLTREEGDAYKRQTAEVEALLVGAEQRVEDLRSVVRKYRDRFGPIDPAIEDRGSGDTAAITAVVSNPELSNPPMDEVMKENLSLRQRIAEMENNQVASNAGDQPMFDSAPVSGRGATVSGHGKVSDGNTTLTLRPALGAIADRPLTLDEVTAFILEALAVAEDRNEKVAQRNLEAELDEEGLASRTMVRYAIDVLKGQSQIIQEGPYLSLATGGRAQVIAIREQNRSKR